MDRELYNYIAQDQVAMESLNDMRLAQPPKDRLGYFDKALEGSAEANANLLQKLYIDTITKSNIDFGDIPDSRGNLRSYKGYKLMEQSISKLNQIYEGIPSDNMKRLNGLHDMIISCQKDFAFGFTNDVELVKLIYNTSVMSLHEMIGVCLFEYTDSLKNNVGSTFNYSNSKKQNLIITKNVDSLLKAYNNGQFSAMMKEFKKNPNMLAVDSVATESIEDTIGSLAFVAQKVGEHGGDIAKKVGNAITTHPAISVPVIVVGALILILIIVRNLVYLFWNKTIGANDYLRAEKEILDIEIENEKAEGAPSKRIKSHRKVSDKLQRLADFIEVKILHSDKAAKQDLAKSNKENYTKSSLGSTSPAFTSEMQF